jgi:hypothetical protein
MFCNSPSYLIRRAIVALVSCGLLANIASAQEPDARDLLIRMGDEIAGLQSYSLSGDAYADARLDEGLIIEHASQATLRVRKPDSVRITNTTSEDVKELYFASGVLTVYTQSRNFYGQTEIPEGAVAALDYAVNEIGVDAPMLDFVSGDVAERFLANATDIQYLGTSLIRGKIYEHVAIRTPEIDIQLWIAAEGRPLPGKMSLSAKWDGGSPRTVIFMDWNTNPDFPDGAVHFDPPKGATKISFAARPSNTEQ